MENVTVHKVARGECAWKYAQKTLQTNGKKPSTAEIIAEMNRLAKLNNCKNFEDFNNKFFNRVGSEFICDEKATAQPKQPVASVRQQKPVHNLVKSDTTAVSDNTRVGINKQLIPNNPKVKADTAAVADSAKTKVNTPQTPVRPKINTPAVTDSTKLKVATVAVSDSTKVKQNVPVQEPSISAEEQRILDINNLSDDTKRIIEYNKTNYTGEYYGIVDKKTCELKIYDKEGNVVKTFVVGVGKTKGDNLLEYYMERAEKTDDAWKAENSRYTTAGEFTLDEYPKNCENPNYTGSDGKLKVMALKGDNRGKRSAQMAIHMLYKPNYDSRKAAIDSPELEDNRMSYGCVNLTEEDYDVMHSFLGEGNKIYVLPEEEGNKLQLEKQSDGTYKFEQQYHKDDERGMSKELASRVKYDVKPENDPKYIKKKAEEAAALEQQRLLAQQEAEKNQVKWYNPFSWFS